MHSLERKNLNRFDDMQYNKDSRIVTLDDVKRFFAHLVNERRVNFHPDDRFEVYRSYVDGICTFSQDECDVYNRLMDESFEVCEENDIDIYDVGIEFLQNA